MRTRALALAAVLGTTSVAHALPGFYVSAQGARSRVSEVAIVREGTMTFLTVKSDYDGPAGAFAMVLPVPTTLTADDVRTLPREVFTRLDELDAPRLAEYWEQDPCASYEEHSANGHGARSGLRHGRGPADDYGVAVQARFSAGEYQIVILSAADSTGLVHWLQGEKYEVPEGAETVLRPTIDAGMRFLVARVDLKDGPTPVLSPLRLRYESKSFSLPVSLGLLDSPGTQDLVVHVLAQGQRYEVAGYPNASIPTNLDVQPAAKDDFAGAYAALFDREAPGAVVTEYAWDARTCDPCPGPPLSAEDIVTLGGSSGAHYVLTRLHTRYDRSSPRVDIVFRPAPPLSGGREFRGGDGALELGARVSTSNQFQARYTVRHPWTGAVSCEHPARGHWGGPASGLEPAALPATTAAPALRDPTKLSLFPTMALPAISPSSAPEAKPVPPTSGCNQGEGSGRPGLACVALLALFLVRRRGH